jgi:hypothetical protein
MPQQTCQVVQQETKVPVHIQNPIIIPDAMEFMSRMMGRMLIIIDLILSHVLSAMAVYK